jgi:hypothetical protein
MHRRVVPSSPLTNRQRAQVVSRLAELPDGRFDAEVLRWVAAADTAYAAMAKVFRDRQVSARTVAALTDLRTKILLPSPAPDSTPLTPQADRLLERIDTELEAVLTPALWGRVAPATGSRAPVLTDDDEEEIEWALEAEDAEFEEAVREWLRYGDDDNSGRRVFLSPQVAPRTHRVIGALIWEASQAIRRARRQASDGAEHGTLREQVRELEALRDISRQQAGLHIRVRRFADFQPPEPLPQDQGLLEEAARMDDVRLRGVLSQWVQTPHQAGWRVYLSRDLIDRTLPIFRALLIEVLERRKRADERGNPDQIAHLAARTVVLNDEIVPRAIRVQRVVRREERDQAPPSARQEAYRLLGELLGAPERGGRRAWRVATVKAHPHLFAVIRNRIAGGEDPQDLLAELKEEGTP